MSSSLSSISVSQVPLKVPLQNPNTVPPSPSLSPRNSHTTSSSVCINPPASPTSPSIDTVNLKKHHDENIMNSSSPPASPSHQQIDPATSSSSPHCVSFNILQTSRIPAPNRNVQIIPVAQSDQPNSPHPTKAATNIQNSTTNPLLHRPNIVRFYSTPTLPCMSPTRQHFRLPNSHPRQIKVCIFCG